MRAWCLAKQIGLLGLLAVALGLGGCVYVPEGSYGPGYYAPAAVVPPPVVVAPRPVVIAPRPYPYFHGYYGWGYRRW